MDPRVLFFQPLSQIAAIDTEALGGTARASSDTALLRHIAATTSSACTCRRAGVCRLPKSIVLCHPWGQEYLRAHRSMRQLGNLLAAAGHHVFRLDYFGTGDSGGRHGRRRPRRPGARHRDGDGGAHGYVGCDPRLAGGPAPLKRARRPGGCPSQARSRHARDVGSARQRSGAPGGVDPR